ncbi:acylphosphatase [Candidatus Bathyarchaeota archaeon]|nr:acylphosphatase [Candidatus Bathyarchaeota archaeon]
MGNQNDLERLHAYVSGRVQGVFFRATTRRKARKFGVTGWVKNLPNGKVEVLAEGRKDKLDKLERFLQEGPRAARVEDVDVSRDVVEEKEHGSFFVKR